MITIKEIAELTGVSTTTVSNVIHGKTHKVSKNTIDKVQQALKAGGYVQRQGLEALTSRHARLVMAVVHTTRRYVNTPVSDPFFGQVIGAIEEELRACGYDGYLTAEMNGFPCKTDAVIWRTYDALDCIVNS